MQRSTSGLLMEIYCGRKMVAMTGDCLCGQVRYSANAGPAFVGVCNCTYCQKQTGSAFSVLVGISKSAMFVQGRVKTFNDTGDSGQPVERNFCPECGSPIYSDVAVMPGVTFVKGWHARRYDLARSYNAHLLRQRRALDAYSRGQSKICKDADLSREYTPRHCHVNPTQTGRSPARLCCAHIVS